MEQVINISDSEIQKLVLQLAAMYRKEIDDNGVNASGALRDFSTEVTFDGRYFSVFFNLQEYWKYVENGRAAGNKFPPIDDIKRWIEIKPVVPRAVNGKVPSLNQLAYLISRKIAREGIEPRNILSQSLDKSEVIIDSICDVLSARLEKIIDNELNEL